MWPTIATGVSPEEHGIILHSGDFNKNLPYQLAQRAAGHLPRGVRDFLAEERDKRVGDDVPVTRTAHAFEDGVVTNWPGATPCHDWGEETMWFRDFESGDIPAREFRDRYSKRLGEQIGWLAGAHHTNHGSAQSISTFYFMGQAYASQPTILREYYEQTDEFVGWLRTRLDNLQIVSDHGMQTTLHDDEAPGVHSWHGLVSSTIEGSLPETVRDVADWIHVHKPEPAGDGPGDEQVEMPTEHLLISTSFNRWDG